MSASSVRAPSAATLDRIEPSSPDRDRQLRLSRRLDWRFLLPDPRLGRVGVVGPPDGEMLEALECFAASWAACVPGALFDLVVVSEVVPNWDAIRAVLVPGGSVYVEAKSGPLDRPELPSIRSCAERAGFEDLRFHWHRPSFRACQEIVPIDEPALVRWILRRRPQNRRAALRLGLLRLARALRCLDRAYGSYSVIARRPGGDA